MEMLEDEAPKPPLSRRMIVVGPLWSLIAFPCAVLTLLAVKPGLLPFGETPPPDFVYWQPNASPWFYAALSVWLASTFLMAKTMYSRSWFLAVIATAVVALAGCCGFMMRSGVAITASEVIARPGPFWSPDRSAPLSDLQEVRTACIRTSGRGAHYEPQLRLVFSQTKGGEWIAVGKGVHDWDLPVWLDGAARVAALPTVEAAPHVPASAPDFAPGCLRHFANLLDPDRQRLLYAILGVPAG